MKEISEQIVLNLAVILDNALSLTVSLVAGWLLPAMFWAASTTLCSCWHSNSHAKLWDCVPPFMLLPVVLTSQSSVPAQIWRKKSLSYLANN